MLKHLVARHRRICADYRARYKVVPPITAQPEFSQQSDIVM
ncbi:hypothetical protein FG05_35340 [Fusarium graminearum]|nr:hypothetical protein FG05_35340 [Fusarium graminearum]